MLFKSLSLATVVVSALQVQATITAKDVVKPLHEITTSTTEYVDGLEALTPENVAWAGWSVDTNIEILTNTIHAASDAIGDPKAVKFSNEDQSFITDALIAAAYAEISFLKDLLAKHDLFNKDQITRIGKDIRCMKSFDDPYGDRLVALIPNYVSKVSGGFDDLTAVYDAVLKAFGI